VIDDNTGDDDDDVKYTEDSGKKREADCGDEVMCDDKFVYQNETGG